MAITSTAIAGLIFARTRRLVEIFPEGWRELWNEWEIRGMVLISLSFQIVLMVLGNRRKYVTNNWTSIILWLAYSSANTLATASLGIISNEDGDENDGPLNRKDVILAFWAPFLLLNLGGTLTITAYSLEDNELWLRNMFGPLLQLLLAVYIFLKSWMGTPLNYLAIPLFIAGLVKNGERIWVQRSASINHFQASMLPLPDPGPSYVKFMVDYVSKSAEGFDISLEAVAEGSTVLCYSPKVVPNDIVPDAAILRDSNYFFNIFKQLFANHILSFQDIKISQSFFHNGNMNWEKAFKVIEVELGLIYDILYTKAIVSYTLLGHFLRVISLNSIIFVFIAFLLIDKHAYSPTDINITYFLLVGALALEIYEILVMLPSDQTMLWLSKHNNLLVNFAYYAISSLIALKQRWSNTMAKYNLISFCLEDKSTKCAKIQKKFLFIYELLEKHRYQYFSIVSPDLKSLIFEQLMRKSRDALNVRVSKQLCAQRGDQVLKDMGCFDAIGWSVEVEFHQSILLWHIATNLCYSVDENKDAHMVENRNCESSKSLADYMLYLLVIRPFMLPNGIGLIRFQDTCAETMDFFQQKGNISNRSQACKELLQVNTDVAPSEVKGDRCKSVLFDACRLAKYIESLETEKHWPNERKWEMVSHVWVEILSHAASQCQWLNHAKLLPQGGELLTHVWLLMAHLGITEQFQISQGHARVRLVVS